jgi:predicted nucleotidyltransferase
MRLRKYTRREFNTLLKAIDANLEQKVEIIVIGGAAALLRYKSSHLTSDIDSFNNVNKLQAAYKKAKKETGLDIPLSQAGVADGPYNFEDRLKAYKGISMKKLIVKIPEIHDLILMKTVRGYEHDLEVIEEMCKKNRVSQKVLVERYKAEMGHVIGNKSTLDLNFAAMLSRCFGDAAAQRWFKSR